MFASTVGFSTELRFLRYRPSYMHCCRALTLALAKLSCKVYCNLSEHRCLSVEHSKKQRTEYFFTLIDIKIETKKFKGVSRCNSFWDNTS